MCGHTIHWSMDLWFHIESAIFFMRFSESPKWAKFFTVFWSFIACFLYIGMVLEYVYTLDWIGSYVEKQSKAGFRLESTYIVLPCC